MKIRPNLQNKSLLFEGAAYNPKSNIGQAHLGWNSVTIGAISRVGTFIISPPPYGAIAVNVGGFMSMGFIRIGLVKATGPFPNVAGHICQAVGAVAGR